MTLLELFQKAMERSGETDHGAAPTTITDLKGIEGRFLSWIQDAWFEIQEERQDYDFMRKLATFDLSADKQDYSLVELNITDLDRWEFTGARYYPTGEPSKKRPLFSEINYQDLMQARYDFGVPLSGGPPVSVMTKDGTFNDLFIYPNPDQAYTVEIPYFRAPVLLTAAGEEPHLQPENLQRIIIWRALLFYAYYDGAPEIADQAQEEYARLSSIIDSRYKPQMTIDHFAHSIGAHR